MAIPSFFKQNKPRGFNYIPRYYDPVKEELEQRRRELERERIAKQEASSAEAAMDNMSSAAGTTETSKPSSHEAAGDGARQPYRTKIMRGDMKNYFPHRREKMRKQSSVRLIVILIIVAFIIYIYLRF